MSSAITSAAEVHPQEVERRNLGLGDDEPLLGRIGDASQREGNPLYRNLFLGTGILAQLGLILLAVVIWLAIFLHPLSFFSLHPLFNSTAAVIAVESVLILQPTHTASQKRVGTLSHASLHFLAVCFFIAAFTVIETTKSAHGAPHFTSAHGRLGLATYAVLALQALVGFTQYFTPGLYGGVDRAKRVYKWHRALGYVILLLLLATVAAATQTETGRDFLELRLWAVLGAAGLVLLGVLPRVKKEKFGFGGARPGVRI